MRAGARTGTLVLAAVSVLVFVAGALATRGDDRHSPNISLAFTSPTKNVNSDMAFWGERAYVANYGGFRIFDISRPARPKLLSSFRCFGRQGDPVVWGNKLLFLAVDRVLTGPKCGSLEAKEPVDPQGWEGVRIFDVSDPARPRFVKGVYTDCGAHTITLGPKVGNELRIYVSSYSLLPGPTCGPVRGPAVGRDPLHGVIQVLAVPLDNPAATKEIAEPRISYPGDPDNRWDPAEHGIPAQAHMSPTRACHDIGVFVELRLAAAACAEQAQLWRIDRNGIPDTAHPLWVYDDSEDTDGVGGRDVAVDFWHSATFSWDGRVVNFVDESVGDGCPPVTRIDGVPSDTGRMFFLDVATGAKLSHFMISRPEANAYCSAHVGNVVRTRDADLLVNAWYSGGVDVVDFTNPRSPSEVAWYDIASAGASPGSFNWSAYWYEGPGGGPRAFPIYGNDLEANPPSAFGFEVFLASLDVDRIGLAYLNPQTQERVLR
jgi:LVIVD repeat-containing protein